MPDLLASMDVEAANPQPPPWERQHLVSRQNSESGGGPRRMAASDREKSSGRVSNFRCRASRPGHSPVEPIYMRSWGGGDVTALRIPDRSGIPLIWCVPAVRGHRSFFVPKAGLADT
jgi:hypothetical protein